MCARERRSSEQEVAAGGSNPGRTNIQGLKITEKESAAFGVCYDVCKLLDFLVLTDKDEKPYVPSHSIFISIWFLWDVKEPTPVSGGVAVNSVCIC